MEAEAEAALRESSVIEVQHQLIGETAPLFFHLPPQAGRRKLQGRIQIFSNPRSCWRRPPMRRSRLTNVNEATTTTVDDTEGMLRTAAPGAQDSSTTAGGVISSSQAPAQTPESSQHARNHPW